MPLILETGAGVANANSYADLSYADEYFSTHPFFSDAWSDLQFNKENLLIAATRQLDLLFNWYGIPYRTDQALGWPRTIYGYTSHNLLVTDVMPDRLRQATCEMAFHMSRGDPFATPASEGLEALRIDVIELQFNQSKKAAALPAPVAVLLRGLGEYAFGGRVRQVQVG